MSIASHAKAVVSLSVIALNLAFWTLPVLALGLCKWAVPALRETADAGLEWIYRTALAIDDLWLKDVMGIRWQSPPLGLSKKQNVIVLSNHVSWADILLMQSVITRQGPILKFLAKRELVFIPIFGAIFWSFDFPLLRRVSRPGESESERRQRDLESIEEACRVLERRPSALVSFAEGTRATPEKRARRGSPYAHLLEPRVGGFSAVLDALAKTEVRVVDLTLAYPAGHSFWRFLGGENRSIEIEAQVFEADEIPRRRDDRAAWLAERWAQKDRRIAKARGESA